MKLNVKAGLSVGAVALGLVLFQNCSGAKPGDLATGDTSTNQSSLSNATTGNGVGGSSGSSNSTSPSTPNIVVPGGNGSSLTVPAPTTGVPLQATNPESPGVCYDVTCASDAGAFKTVHGYTKNDGTISGLSPTTGSAWIVAINSSHKVYSSLNCYVDASNDSQNRPDFNNASLCRNNAPSLINAYSFNQGKGRFLSTCTIVPCGYLASDFYADGQGFYESVAAGYSATAKSAVFKLRVRDYHPTGGVNAGAPFGLDATVPLGQCVVQSVNTSTGAISYNICLGNDKSLRAVTPQHTFTLSLGGLNSVN